MDKIDVFFYFFPLNPMGPTKSTLITIADGCKYPANIVFN